MRTIPSRGAFVVSRTALCLTLMAAACGKPKHSVSVAPGDPNQHEDAGGDLTGDASLDGSVAQRDSGSDTGTSAQDGAVDTDAGVETMESCTVAADDDSLLLPMGVGTDATFSVTSGVTGFGVAYHAVGCGVIGTLLVSADGAFAKPAMVLGDCFSLADVALMHATDGWRAAWVDNSAGSAELQTMPLSNDLIMGTDVQRTRLTTNSLHESKPLFANIAGVPHLAWISEDLTTGKRQIDRKRFDSKGAVENLVSADSGRKPASMAFAQLATTTAALAYLDEDGMPGIWLQPLDKTVKAMGNPVLVTSLVTTGNSVDLATREEDGGAIVYSVDIGNASHEVRFRRLDKNGAFISDEIKIAGSPLQARDASIGHLGAGYAVAYRQLATDGSSNSQIRLQFITKEGNVTHDSEGRLVSYLVADTTVMSGPVTLRVSTDGQVLVGFLDVDASGQNQMHIVRKRLDCAL
jgi:hypothetical protein